MLKTPKANPVYKDRHSYNSFSHLQILCMQEFFEEVSQRLASEDLDMVEILQDVSMKKRQKVVEGLSKTDAESIYDAIEGANTLLDIKKNV